MKSLVLQFLLFVLLAPLACYGRVGETHKQLIERYGEPASKKEDEEGEYLTFLKSGIAVHCVVREGIAAAVIYNFFRDIKETEAQVLLVANGSVVKWKKAESGAFKLSWIRDDGVLSASVTRGAPHILTIAYDSVIRAEGQKAMKSDEKDLTDF